MCSANNSSSTAAAAATADIAAVVVDHAPDLVQQVMEQVEGRIQTTIANTIGIQLIPVHAKMDHLITAVDNLQTVINTLINEVRSNPSALQIPGGGTTSGDTTIQESHQAKTPSVVPSTPDLLGQPSPFTYNATPGTPGVKAYTRLLASSDMSSPSTSSHIISPAKPQPKPPQEALPDLVVVSHHSLALGSSKPPVKSSEASGEQYSVEEQQQQKSFGNPRSSEADSVFNHSIDDYRPLAIPYDDDDDNKSVYDSVYEEPTTYTTAKSHSDNTTGDGEENVVGASADANKADKSDNKAAEKNQESPFKTFTSPLLRVGQFFGISSASNNKTDEKSHEIPPPPPPHASSVTPLNKDVVKEEKAPVEDNKAVNEIKSNDDQSKAVDEDEKAPVVDTKAADEVKRIDDQSKDVVKEEKAPFVDTKGADQVKSIDDKSKDVVKEENAPIDDNKAADEVTSNDDDDKVNKFLEPYASVVMNESYREPRVIYPSDDLSESKLDNSGNKLDESDTTEDDGYEAQKFDIVTVKETESQSTKSEDVLFKNECKLTIFDYDTKQSNELGLGNISIAYNSESGCCQVQMKRHRDEKICADFTIRETSFLTDKSRTKYCGIIRCEDISEDGTPKSTYFIIRFRELKPYDEFKKIFNEAVQNIPRNNTTEKLSKSKLVQEAERIGIPFKKQCVTHNTPMVDSVTPAAAATSSSGVKFGTPTLPPKNFSGFGKSQKSSAADDDW